MKVSIISDDAKEARKQAEAKIGHRGIYISSVFFLPKQPTMREWVFSSVLLG